MAVKCHPREHRWIRHRKYSHEFKCGICKIEGVKPIRMHSSRYQRDKPWEQSFDIIECYGIELPNWDELYF